VKNEQKTLDETEIMFH